MWHPNQEFERIETVTECISTYFNTSFTLEVTQIAARYKSSMQQRQPHGRPNLRHTLVLLQRSMQTTCSINATKAAAYKPKLRFYIHVSS